MTAHDVRVARLSLKARSTQPALAVRASQVTEKAIRDALERVVSGEPLVVIRHVRLVVRGTVTQPQEIEQSLERELARVIATHIEGAVEISLLHPTTAQSVVFPNEATALALYVLVLQGGGSIAWPYSALSAWGKTVPAVLGSARQRGRAFMGDVLAEFARQERLDALFVVAEQLAPAALDDTWLSPSGGRPIVAGLPAPVVRALWQRLERVLSRQGVFARLSEGALEGSPPVAFELTRVARLAVLAELFLRWPPFRDSAFDPREIDELIRAARPTPSGPRGPDLRQPLPPRASKAGGLVYWALLLQDLNVDLDGAFRNAKVREGARWAIARCLEDAALDRRDPLLLAWIGADLDAVVTPALALEAESSEPLFRLAMQALLARFAAPKVVSVCAWGDLVVAFADELVLDVLPARDAHAAVSELVKRLRQRGLTDNPEIHVDASAWGRVADVMAELDTPAVPDAWRGAVLSLTSLLRLYARQVHRSSVRDVRKWPARLLDNGSLELRSREVRQIAGGRWLGDGQVALPSGRLRVREVAQF